MKKVLLTAFMGVSAVAASFAQLNGDGYYRIQNYMTERYAYVTDDKGSVDTGATKVDARAIQLWKGFEKASSDPATVIYIEHVDKYKYDLRAQGISLYGIFNAYIEIYETGQGTYYAYGSRDGFSTYLADGEAADMDKGYMTNTNKGDYRKWYIKPISAGGDQYFGAKCEFKAKGRNYTTMYAGFPMKAYSDGMKAYAISIVGSGMAVLSEVKGVIPAGTPVIWECNYPNASGNRIEIGGSASAVSNNQLGGVYFCNSENNHVNRTKYDRDTMRVMGLLSDGSLGFVTADIEYLPANKAYLKVPAGSPAEIRIVTQAEYDAYMSSMPTSISVSPSTKAMHPGETVKLSVSYLPEGSNALPVTWTSSNPAVAAVAADGTVTAVGNGSATITASTSDGATLSATCAVTVTTLPQSITLTPAGLAMHTGESREISVTFAPEGCVTYPIVWTSSNPAVATVSAEGVVTVAGDGSATITATTDGEVSLTATCQVTVTTLPESITVSPAAADLHKGETMAFVVTYEPSNAEHLNVIWWSDDENIATVDENGVVTATGNGTVGINALADGVALTSKAMVTVTTLAGSITVNPTEYRAEPGTQFSIVATVLPDDTSDKSVVGSSDNEEVATVDADGLVSVVAEGMAEIRCTTADGTGLTAVCKVSGVAGVGDIIAAGEKADVYTVSGIVVKRGATAEDIRTLPAGMYVIGGNTVVIR